MPQQLLQLDGLTHPQPIAWTALRGAAVYFGALILVRLGKRRMLARTTAFDILLAFMLGSMFSRAINGTAPLLPTFAAGALLVAIHSVIGKAAYHFTWFDTLVNGRPRKLVADGRPIPANLRHEEVSERDLLEELRLRAGLTNPADAAEAWMERNGEISAVPKRR